MDNRNRSTALPGSNPAGESAKPKWRPSEKELTLRCHCPACRRMIIVPLTILGTDEVCPACSQRVRIPTLDRKVTGLDIVRRFLSAERTAPPVTQSKEDDIADDVHGPRAGGATETLGARNSPADSRRDEPLESTSSRHGPPPLPDRQPRDTRSRDSDFNDKEGGYGSFREFATDARSLVKGATARLADFTSTVSGSLFRSPRRVRYALTYGIWLGPIALMVLTDIVVAITYKPEVAAALFCAFAFVGIHWWFIGALLARWLTPLILAFLFPIVRCPFCQDDIPMFGLWHCGCGYHDNRERHAMRFRCPKCGDRFGYLNCPRCEATVLF